MPVEANQKIYDLLIQNAEIYDGVSIRPITADLGIIGDKIAAVGELDASRAHRILDASGFVLTPGFVDAHTHSDFNALVYPRATHKITQGVTTEIVGNCGMSAAPLSKDQQSAIRSAWAREGVYLPSQLPWSSVSEYFNKMENTKLPNNLMLLIGHGNLRFSVMGSAARPADAEEIKQMQNLLRREIKNGAAGISFGLVYLPGIYAEQNEIISLCRTAGKEGGVCAFHMRSEGSKLLESIAETITIGEETGARIQISHLKAAGPANWPKIGEALRLIREAQTRGVQIYADAYPYTASYAELGVVLPDRYFERQDRSAFFQNPENRAIILKTLQEHYLKNPRDWDRMMIASVAAPDFKSYEGKTIHALSLEKELPPEEILLDLLAGTEFEVSAFNFSQDQNVVDHVMETSFVMPGSDSIADGTHYPHPRVYGTFPRFLQQYVVEKKSVALGEAVRRMTSLPAMQFNIPARGVIKVGYVADLVVWDAFSIRDLADYQQPKKTGQGIQYVILAGKTVVEKGKYIGDRNGQLLAPARVEIETIQA